VVVSGPPGSGKTTVAGPLARALGLPLLAKDTVKEALMDSLGVDGLERSRELGRAAFAVLFAVAGCHLDAGAGLVLDANFARSVSEPSLEPLVARSRAAVVHCGAPREVLVARYRARAPERHPGHYDLLRLGDDLPWLAPPATEPPELGVPCLRVDTAGAWEPAAIADWTRSALQSR
jgi:predicted kinase